MKLKSYLAPVCAVAAIAFADYCIIVIQPHADKYIWIAIYNLIVALALWSLISTFLSDPGYVPINGKYDLSNMPRLVASLYQQISKYQNVKVDISEI